MGPPDTAACAAGSLPGVRSLHGLSLQLDWASHGRTGFPEAAASECPEESGRSAGPADPGSEAPPHWVRVVRPRAD